MSDTMTEGVIVAWHKQVGDIVKSGDLLAEVETDKATMELESYNNGTLLHIGVAVGSAVPVDGVLAVIGKQGEAFESLLKDGPLPTQEANTTAATTPVDNSETSTPTPAATATPATASTTIDVTTMPEVVLMPRMSDTMTEGVIADWHKQIGDSVKSGDLLAEVETDKATMELESYVAGTLLYIGVPKGGKVPVNQLLAIIGDASKIDVAAVVAAASSSNITTTDTTTTTTVQAEPTAIPQAAATVATTPAPTVQEPVQLTNGKIKASPLAKRIAQEKGIDLHTILGSGDGGRIIKHDIDNYTPAIATAATAATTTPAITPAAATVTLQGTEGYTDVPNSQMRKTIAKRLSESMYTAPHFYLKIAVNMNNAIAARAAMNAVSPVKISFQDMMIKACAMALKQHPAVNSSWMGDYIRTYSHIHIGSAVAVEDGLIVPVFKHADAKSLSQIAAEANDLYTKAKTKKLQPAEFTGNTFTISNLGMMDIEEFTAIINPPDSAILAVGKISEVVVKDGDGFGVHNILKLTLSCDHRLVDGAVGAKFLGTLKGFLENPVTMLV